MNVRSKCHEAEKMNKNEYDMTANNCYDTIPSSCAAKCDVHKVIESSNSSRSIASGVAVVFDLTVVVLLLSRWTCT